MQRIKKKRYCKGHYTLTHARARPNRMKNKATRIFRNKPNKGVWHELAKNKKIVNMHM